MRIQANTPKARVAAHSLSLEPSRLRLLTPEGDALRFPTDGSTFWLGSSDKCLIQREGAAPQHAEARWNEGTLEVRGENTLVNGMPAEDWSPLGDGGHIQLGDINQPALSLAALSDQPGATSQKPIAITYFGDATAPNIASGVARQPATFNKFLAQGGKPVQVQGVLLSGSKLSHLAQAAVPVAMGAAALGGIGTCVAGLIHGLNAPLLVLGGIMTATGGVAAYSTRESLVPHWQAATGKITPGGLPSQQVQVNFQAASPSAARFDEAWKKSLSSWPQSRQIVYISGHGYQDKAAGIYFGDVSKSVQGAEAVLLDACNGGQIEALLKLADSARVAVCSEHTVRASGFPIQSMFEKSEFPEDSRALATELVRSAAKGRPAASMVAVDLQALKSKLLPSLDKLGRRLQTSNLDEVREALLASETTDTNSKTTVDLGSFLARLPELPEVLAARQALNQTVLAMVGHGTISFDRYSPSHMPSGWRDLTQQLRRK
jgi:hypothetical protein